MTTNLPSSTIADGSLPEPSRLLRTFAAWPLLRVERHGPRAVLYGGVHDIGEVDVHTGTLTVAVDPEAVGPLLERHPQLQPIAGGVRLAVTDAAGRRAAEALVRWRIDLERFAPQMAEASP